MRKNGASALPSASAAVTDAMPSSISCLACAIRHLVAGERMVLAVGADGVAGVAQLAHAFRIGVGLLADQEERRLDAVGGENLQDLVAVFRQRTVVEGQHHLMIPERQRFRILHGADDGMCARIDHERARRADRVGMAGAIGGRRGRRGSGTQAADTGEKRARQRTVQITASRTLSQTHYRS